MTHFQLVDIMGKLNEPINFKYGAKLIKTHTVGLKIKIEFLIHINP